MEISNKEIANNKTDKARKKSQRFSTVEEENNEDYAIPSDINIKKWPRQTFAILAVEACERFAFYGMKSVLGLYFKDYLGKREDESSSIYHTFVSFLYITPILGAIIADSFWGRFKTIWRLSLVYLLGMILLTVSSIPTIFFDDISRTSHLILTYLGLFCIGLGAGGIKPCVSPFGADQFHKNAVTAKESYFRWFYMLINIGACVGGYLTPLLRDRFDMYSSHDSNDLYSHFKNSSDGVNTATFAQAFNQAHVLSFGIPTILFIIALIFYFLPEIFTRLNSNIFGKYIKNEPNKSENIAFTFFRVVIKKNSKDQYERAACYQVVKLFVRIFLPLSFFWCLLDGTGTFWTYSACQGDGLVVTPFGSYPFICDQLEVINPIMVILLIPIYNYLLNPLIMKCFYEDKEAVVTQNKFKRDISKKSIDYMLAGMIICTFAAVLSYRFDEKLSKNLPSFDTSEINTRIIPIRLYTADSKIIDEIERCNPNIKFDRNTGKTDFMEFEGQTLHYGEFDDKSSLCDKNVKNILKFMDQAKTKPIQHHKLLSIQKDEIVVRHVKNELAKQFHIEIFDETDGFNKVLYNGYNKTEIEEKLLKKYPLSEEKFEIFWADIENRVLKDGARFIVTDKTVVQLHECRSVSVVGLIPQYFMLTLAEVFISITALEFAYTQAPNNMRTLCTGFWYATVAIGNIIVVGISEVKVSRADKQLIMAFCLAFGSTLYYFLSKKYKVLSIDDVIVKFEAPLSEESEVLTIGELENELNPPTYNSNDHSQIELLKQDKQIV